jgi:hypothetical protein
LTLAPFLDTEFTPNQHEQTLVALEKIGLSRREVTQIRGSVESSMLAYNGLHWNWVHLGLYDVLTATRHRIGWLPFSHRLLGKRYNDFYWSAMELADRGRNVIA